MSSSAEAAADEDPAVANNPDDNVEAVAANVSDADTEPGMLEEEEMPSYMILAGSSMPDETAAELGFQRHAEDAEDAEDVEDVEERGKGVAKRASSPYASDDQGGGSIYVVSSGEESNRGFDDEDYESDEMELEDEEEEEDEDDSRAGYHDDEEDSEGDIEPEQFERSSDDFVLRYDTGLEKHHKTRSRSLQDLTNSRGNLSRFVGKRRSVDIMGNYNPSLATQQLEIPQDPLADVKKPSRSRYANVPSKVKLYIEAIKKQSRRSMELKNSGNAVLKNFNEAKGGSAEVSCTRINPINIMVKNHALNLAKMPTELKNATVPDVTYGGRRLGEKIPDKEPIIVSITSKQFNDIDATRKNPTISINPTTTTNNLPKSTKSNGIIDCTTENHDENVDEPMETCETNGDDQITEIFDLRTLSYEEYANGGPASNIKIEDNEALPVIDEEKNLRTQSNDKQEIPNKKEIEKIQRSTSLQKEIPKISPSASQTVQPIPETSELSKSTVVNETDVKNPENPDVTMLWTMLDQKSAQFNEKKAQYEGIRDAFQKTLAENIILKRELEELKKTLAKCQTDNKPRDTKVASVQTESNTVTEETKISVDETKISITESKPPSVKLLSSSVDSALTSIEQWSDSNCSPAISLNPPNMDHVLNSDDSLILNERTPRRESRNLSHSFITSSRILQTLANITQGRTKTASQLAKDSDSRVVNDQGQSKQSESFIVSGNEANESRTRKRKASDMLGFSGQGGRFKIPNTSDVPRKRINSDFDTDGVFKSPRERSTVGGNNEPIAGGSKDVDNANSLGDDYEDSEATDVPENVKCFVYREESDSKERSFLIQAEEPSKNGEIGEKGSGTVRECGPYLLGNVEIRMCEANGTINIWGKEVSQESEYVDVEGEKEESYAEEDPSIHQIPSHDDQKTPSAKFVNGTGPFVCSTNKKSKLSPQFFKSNIDKYFRPAVLNSARVNALARDRETGRCASSPSLNDRETICEHCETHKKRQFHWPTCDCTNNFPPKRHSCCRQEVEINDDDCDCSRDREHLDADVILEIVTNILSNRKKFGVSSHGFSKKNCCYNHGSKETCDDHSPRRRNSPEGATEFRHPKKRCSSCSADLPSCGARLTPGNVGYCASQSRSDGQDTSCDTEDRPLLQNGHYETPETKRRRLSGKKVRGILTDLLRGCGGCRDHNNASFVTKESSSLPNINPPVRVTPCTPPASAKSSTDCSSHSKKSGYRDPNNENFRDTRLGRSEMRTNQGCCCSRRDGTTAEIESKLEFLIVEMERLRSRSDSFRGTLNLLNADAD